MPKTLTRNQMSNAVNAFHFSELTGTPLTIPINVNWSTGIGKPPAQALADQHRFLKLAGQWLAYYGIPQAWMWVMECPSYRLHSHVNLHLPDDPALYRAFRAKAFSWIPTEAELKFSRGGTFMALPKDRQNRARYVLKAVGSDATIRMPDRTQRSIAELLDLSELIERKGDQGDLPVKRFGVSRSIDKAARAKAGYVDTQDPFDWLAILPPPEQHRVAA